MRAAQDKVLRDRREAELKAARDAEGTDEEKAAAQLALDDFYTEERIANAEAAAEAAGTNAQKSVDDLVAQFNRGSISADEFRTKLRGIVGADMGDELGAAFGTAFNEALQNALAQAELLARKAFQSVTGTGGGETVNPAETAAAEQRAYAAWAKRRDNFTDALAKAKPGGKWKSAKVRDDFIKKWKADDLAEWQRRNTPPPRSTLPLAAGGILRRAVLAGEAGPEAVIPLDGARGRTVLARAMRDAGAAGGRGPVTINLTFQGVLDAREAARRIQPELDRIVSLI
jgi:hypothetical protein